MMHSSERHASALLSIDASRSARVLRCVSSGQRAALAQHMQALLQQWQDQWGLKAVAAGSSMENLSVRCDLFSEMRGEGYAWKPLRQEGETQEIWWSVAPAPVVGNRPATNCTYRGASVLLTAISNALFGETVNLKQDTTPRYVASHSVSHTMRVLREEPAVDPNTGLAVDIVFAAWHDWCSRIEQVLGRKEMLSNETQTSAPTLLAE